MLAKNPSATLADLRTPRRIVLETLAALPFATALDNGGNSEPDVKQRGLDGTAMAAAGVIASQDADRQRAVNYTAVEAAGNASFVSTALPPLPLDDDPLASQSINFFLSFFFFFSKEKN